MPGFGENAAPCRRREAKVLSLPDEAYILARGSFVSFLPLCNKGKRLPLL